MASVANGIHRIGVDGAAAVIALVVVKVVLIGTTELEQVIAPQQGKVVAEHIVQPIPETPADLLVVHVERSEVGGRRLATLDFQRATQPGNLRWSSRPVPGPPVAQVAEVKVVGEVVGKVAREPRYQVPVLNRITGQGGRGAQLIAGEEAANVNLVARGY